MKISIIKIGNSKGIRIPKVLLDEAGLKNQVELTYKDGQIVIEPIKTEKIPANEEALLSEKSLGDWLRPEEDEAWKDLQ